jgi:phage N-6-adenine-methyltransferase
MKKVSFAREQSSARLITEGIEVEASSDEFYTPASIFVALGLRFDLDVASPPGGLPWVPADRFYSQVDDGLLQPWHGMVWCNPPYSKPSPWAERMASHGNGVMLLPGDTSTGWWHNYVSTANAWCFIKGRVRFVNAAGMGSPSWTGRFPSVLVSWGWVAADALKASGLGWCP